MRAKMSFCNVLLLSLLFLLSCSKEGSISTKEILHVEVEKVISKNVPVEIDSFGVLLASKDVDIRSQVSGQKIKKIYFKEGSFVKKGDLLISLDDQVYKANLKIDELSLLQDKEDIALQRYVLEKDKQLFSDGSLPKQTYQRMLTGYLQTEARIKSDQAKIELDKINLEYCSIKSPVNGVIGYVKLDEGNIVTSSDILANVKDIDPLYVDFTVPGKDLFRIKNALKENGRIKLIISVSSEDNDNSDHYIRYDGDLKFLNNKVDETSDTILLRGIIPNTKQDLLPGLFVKVELFVGELQKVLLIPSSGLLLDNDKHYFFTVSSDGKVKKVLIDVIGNYGKYCIALNNSVLKANDLIAVTGLLDLIPGEKIEYNTIHSQDIVNAKNITSNGSRP